MGRDEEVRMRMGWILVAVITAGAVWSCGAGPSAIASGGIRLEPALVIGDADEGIIDGNVTVAEWRRGYAVSHRTSPAGILLFDSTGAFERVLGSEGQGPEEFRSIRALMSTDGGELVVVDGGNSRVVRLSPEGTVLGSAPIQWRGRPFVGGYDLYPNGDLLVNGRARGLADPSWILRWNPDHVVWSLPEVEPIEEDGLREAAVDSDESIWVVTARHRLRIDHISPQGEVIESWSPVRPWFEEWREQEPLTPGTDAHSGFWGPMAWVRDVRVDGDELWLLAITGDDRWRESRSANGIDMGLFSNSVIDVYDKRTGELVTSAEFDLPDEYLIGFLGGDRVVSFRSDELLNHLVVRRIVRD